MKEYDTVNVFGLVFSCIKNRSSVIVLPFRSKSAQFVTKLKYLSFLVMKFSVHC